MFILLLNQEYFMGHVMYLDNREVLSIQVRGHLYDVLNCLNYKSRDFLGVFLDTSLSGTKLSQSQVAGWDSADFYQAMLPELR